MHSPLRWLQRFAPFPHDGKENAFLLGKIYQMRAFICIVEG
jgi:hypothetical protein